MTVHVNPPRTATKSCLERWALSNVVTWHMNMFK